ncbi:MAG: Mce-associated rane protein [Kribbellaceae bacterium]|nr:Mce-associated rane protein [Kribbellaceae bacterium]
MPRRIAGQRRRADNEPEVNPQNDPIEPVTQATSQAPAPTFTEVLAPVPTTESDERPKDVVPVAARSKVGVVLSAALGILLVLILALTAVLGVKAWKGKEAEDARDQAAAAGRKAAETALSYDYRTLDKSFAAARATMTPEFAGQFDATAKVAGELATKTKATVRAEVREVGVRDGDANRVTLIIFVNQTTTSTITKGSPRVDLNRTRFTMVRNGGQWLVQEIAGL